MLVAAAAAAALIALVTAAMAGTQVTVSVDGEVHEVRVLGGTVADALDRLGVEVAPGDVVDPDPGTSVVDASSVVVERGVRVTVLDGGDPRELIGVVASVGEVLERLGLQLRTADVVDPPLDTQARDGMVIVVDRAIRVDVVVGDGVARRVVAPVTTVAEALEAADMAHLRGRDVRVEPGWQEPIEDGTHVVVTFPTAVAVVADGNEETFTTYATDVGAVLAEADVTLGEDDLVTPTPSSALIGPTRVIVRRVTFVEHTDEVVLEHGSSREETEELDRGSTRTEVEGLDGLRRDTYRVRRIDGEEVDRELVVREIVRAPRDERVLIGTYVPPPPPPPPPAAATTSALDEAAADGSAAGAAADGSMPAPTAGAAANGSVPAPTASEGSAPSSGDGFLVAPGSAAGGSGTTVTYSVEVEPGLGLDPSSVAATVDAALLDARSWARDRRLERTASSTAARIRVLVASPGTVDRLCRGVGLDTGGYLSCWTGRFAALNVDRWRNGVPTFGDIALYRRYLVNHEVGHGLGFGHVGCPAQGALAPVMMQQSISLGGCRPNGWPHPG
jgi:uncharacterized protein YabE (DUF348 family)